MYRSIPDGEEGPPGRLRRAGEGEEEVVAAGITSGWAFAGNIGSPSRAEYTVMGDVVNTAARIMGHAAKLPGGGGVCCDSRTREFLLDRAAAGPSSGGAQLGGITLSDERLVVLKGKPEGIRVTDLALEALSPVAGPREGEAADAVFGAAFGSEDPSEDLVGRRPELRQLATIADRWGRAALSPPLPFPPLFPLSPRPAGTACLPMLPPEQASPPLLSPSPSCSYLSGACDSVMVVVEARQGMGKVSGEEREAGHGEGARAAMLHACSQTGRRHGYVPACSLLCHVDEWPVSPFGS